MISESLSYNPPVNKHFDTVEIPLFNYPVLNRNHNILINFDNN